MWPFKNKQPGDCQCGHAKCFHYQYSRGCAKMWCCCMVYTPVSPQVEKDPELEELSKLVKQ